MDPKQLQWIDNELKNARDDWKIVYFHHPLYSSGGRHGSEVDLRVTLEPLFVKYGVNVVYSGHDHIYERIKPQKGIYYFVVGLGRAAARRRSEEIAADRGRLRPGTDLHAERDRRRRAVLPGDHAHRQDHRRRRDHAPAQAETPTPDTKAAAERCSKIRVSRGFFVISSREADPARRR